MIKPNAIVLLALFITTNAHAGYYGQILGRTSTRVKAAGIISNCESNAGAVLTKVSTVTNDPVTIQYTINEYTVGYLNGSTTNLFSMLILPCKSEPGDLPDPSLTGDQTMYEFTNAQMAIDMSFQLFGLALGLYATIWGLKRVAALFSKDVG